MNALRCYQCALRGLTSVQRSVTVALVAFCLSLCQVQSSIGATISITPEIFRVWNPNFTPVDPTQILAPGKLVPRDVPYLVEVAFPMRIRNRQDGQLGFSSTQFNIQQSGDGRVLDADEDGSLWIPNNPDVMPDGIQPGGRRVPLWEVNADLGVNSNDLRQIAIEAATEGFGIFAFDPRITLGQTDDGDLTGWLIVEVPGQSAFTTITVETPAGASTYDEFGISSTEGNSAIGGTLTISVPEPSSMRLLCVLAFCALSRFPSIRKQRGQGLRETAATSTMGHCRVKSIDLAVWKIF